MTTNRNEYSRDLGSGLGVEVEQQVCPKFGSGKVQNAFSIHCAGCQRENALTGLLSG